MTPWAKRIEQRLSELDGKSQAGLAKACGIKAPSVNGWLSGESKMINGANLVASARYLNTTAEWIMTGRGSHNSTSAVREPAAPWPERALPSAEELAAAIEAAQRAFSKLGQIPNSTALAAGTLLALQTMDAGDNKTAAVAAVAKRIKEIGDIHGERLEDILRRG